MRLTGINYRTHTAGDFVSLPQQGGGVRIYRVTSVGIEACTVEPLTWWQVLGVQLRHYGVALRRFLLGA
jgi:hypothetical protein